MWIVCITSVRHVLTVNGYGGRQTKENEKSWCFKGWETLVTYYYNDWIAIGNIIKNMFDEEGRALFHKVSSFYPNYDYDETDSEYSAMIVGQYRYNSDRLFEIAAKYGLIPPIKK